MPRLAALLLLTLLPLAARAQEAPPSNEVVLGNLALTCLADVPAEALEDDDALLFEAPAPTYLRERLLARWREEGLRLYLAEAEAPDEAGVVARPRLRYDVEALRITYERAGRRRVQRRAQLALRYTLTAADGQLLASDACRETYSDVVPRRSLGALASPAFPETAPDPPPPGWLRRYLEPAVLAATLGVGVYLLFSVRSGEDASS